MEQRVSPFFLLRETRQLPKSPYLPTKETQHFHIEKRLGNKDSLDPMLNKHFIRGQG